MKTEHSDPWYLATMGAVAILICLGVGAGNRYAGILCCCLASSLSFVAGMRVERRFR